MSVGGERRTIGLLCYINFLLHVNRSNPGVIVHENDRYYANRGAINWRQSAYPISVALCSLLFGYHAFTRKPFQLITWGLVSWALGAGVCGLACLAENYLVLAAGRVLMGAGEAAFQCNAIPFINRHAPVEKKTVCLGLCIASAIAGSALTYFCVDPRFDTFPPSRVFFVEGVLMVLAITCGVPCVPTELDTLPEAKLSDFSAAHSSDHEPSWLSGFTDLPATLIGLGYGAHTFAVGGIASFSAWLMYESKFVLNISDALMYFGVCGIVGALAGSFALDRLTEGNTVSKARHGKFAVDMMVVLITSAMVCAMAASQLTASKIGWMASLGLTFILLAAILPAQYVAVMERFPESRQPMAMAANTVMMAFVGELLEIEVLGGLDETWVISHRHSDGDKGEVDEYGLKKVILVSSVWLIGSVVFWGAAMFRHRATRDEKDRISIESPPPSPLN